MGVVERQAPFLIETILQEKDMEFEVNRLLSPYLYNDILSSIKRTDFSAFTGKTVLITGASKPLGYYLACALLINNDLNSEGAKLIAVDSSDKLMEKFGKLTYRGDIDFVVTRDYSYLGGDHRARAVHGFAQSAQIHNLKQSQGGDLRSLLRLRRGFQRQRHARRKRPVRLQRLRRPRKVAYPVQQNVNHRDAQARARKGL